MTRREILAATALSAAAAALFTAPIFAGFDRLGICDWDQHEFFYGVPYWSIVEKGEWPFWNPFACGGNPSLADPQSPSLYPLFAVVLAFGVVPGLKVLIWIHAALALFGAWLLGRRLGCGAIAAWLPASAYGLSSAYALHIAAGHATWIAMAWVPLALAALHEGFTRARFAPAAGAAAAMIVLIGNGYLFIYLLLFAALWSLLEAARRRDRGPLVSLAVMAVSALALSAVKTLPLTHFLAAVQNPEVPHDSPSGISVLWHSLMGRDQSLRAYGTLAQTRLWQWWEYGAYVGPVIPFLAAGCAARRLRNVWPLLLVAVLALLLALGDGWGVWDLLRAIPGFEMVRIPSRAIIFAVLILGLLAGLWVTEWENRVPRGWLIAGVALVALDVGWVGSAALHEAFVVARKDSAPGAFRQEIGRKDFQSAWDTASGRYVAAYSEMYPSFLANRGTVNCYDRFHLPVRAQPAELPRGATNPDYRGEAWLASGGTARIASVGGRRIAIDVVPSDAGTLVVNQNFDGGWRSEDGRPVSARDGLLSAPVITGDRRVVFVYTPPRFWPGVVIGLAAVLGIAVAAAVREKRE